jgi:hypothetical protein
VGGCLRDVVVLVMWTIRRSIKLSHARSSDD